MLLTGNLLNLRLERDGYMPVRPWWGRLVVYRVHWEAEDGRAPPQQHAVCVWGHSAHPIPHPWAKGSLRLCAAPLHFPGPADCALFPHSAGPLQQHALFHMDGLYGERHIWLPYRLRDCLGLAGHDRPWWLPHSPHHSVEYRLHAGGMMSHFRKKKLNKQNKTQQNTRSIIHFFHLYVWDKLLPAQYLTYFTTADKWCHIQVSWEVLAMTHPELKLADYQSQAVWVSYLSDVDAVNY